MRPARPPRAVSTTNADRHLPLRTCVGCRRRGVPDTLLRCVIDDDGEVRVSRTAPGRGAWVCGPDCVAPAIAKRGFDRAWRRTVPTEASAAIADVVCAAHAPTEMPAVHGMREMTAVRSGSTRHERLTTRVKG
ncbi:MAG: YlxR family protein [Ilumatobacter sp.]|nr:MAG: YlxR family protein [Ilumatobacter sp.]